MKGRKEMTRSTSIPARLNIEHVEDSPNVDKDVVDDKYYDQSDATNYLPEDVLKTFPKDVLIILGAQGVKLSESREDIHLSKNTDYSLSSENSLKAIVHKSKLILVYAGGGSICGILATLFIISTMKFFDADTVNVNCTQIEETRQLYHHSHHPRFHYMDHIPSCF